MIGSGSVQDTSDVDVIAATVLACASVAGLDEGGTRAVATYLPGRRVAGVRVEEARVLVSVVLDAGSSVRSLAAEVRGALASHVKGRQIDVYVADVRVAGELA